MKNVYKICETDTDVLARIENGYHWTWYVPKTGYEFIPEEGAIEHFEAKERYDLAGLIRTDRERGV